MTVCIDASVIIRWLVPQQSDASVYELVDGWIEEGEDLLGPTLLFSEVISVLRLQAHKGTMDPEDVNRIVSLFLRLGIKPIDNATLHRRAFEMATEFGHSRSYDANYLAAAEQERCDFWTADGPLYNSVRRKLRWVNHVSRSK